MVPFFFFYRIAAALKIPDQLCSVQCVWRHLLGGVYWNQRATCGYNKRLL